MLRKVTLNSILIIIQIMSAYGQTFFKDISESAHLNDSHSARSAACADINNDGWLDIYLCNADYENLLYINSQGTCFDPVSNIFGPPEFVYGHSYSSTWIDIENDGDLDLFVVNQFHRNYLFLNKGNGHYVELGLDRGIHGRAAGVRAAWADYDNDGDLDCYLVNWLSPNKLYRNDNGCFLDVAPEFGIDIIGYGRSALWFDYDNDGDEDLYVANSKNQPDFLFRNDGVAFTDVTGNLQLTEYASSIGVASADYDADGDQDLYVTSGWYEPDRLYKNLGGDGFRRVDIICGFQDQGADTDVSWIDYDNDGDLDIYIVNQKGLNRMYENSGGKFANVAHSVNLADSGEGLGAIWADFNRDGFLDIFLVNGASQENRFFLNSGNSNNWIILKLKGTISNIQAIGAKVSFYAGSLFAFREVQAAWGFASQGSIELEFGLGEQTMIDSIEVKWPSGIRQMHYNVSVNQHLTIVEKGTAFRDVSESAHLNDSHNACSAACADINNDGLLDIYVCNKYAENLFYLNSPTGFFGLASHEFNLFGSMDSYCYSSSWIDIENDGDLDLFVVNQYQQNILFLNKGNEWFVDVAFDRGFYDTAASIHGAWADFDNDGDLDCYLVHWNSPNQLYQNNNGYFFDIAYDLGIDHTGFGRTALWFDYDNDGDMDLYVANSKNQPDILYRNENGLVFTNVTEYLGPANDASSIGVASADYDGDRDQDLYIACGWYESDRIYENLGGYGFRKIDIYDTTADTDVSWVDYDNDGDLDVYVVNQKGANRLLQNTNGEFVDVARKLNLAAPGEGFAGVWGDFNRDGFLDVFIANGNSEPNRLFINSPNSNNWLILNLKGTVSNKQAIGAKVSLFYGGLIGFREVQAGWGFTSQGSVELEFGLGKQTMIDSIEIKWPSGIRQMYYDICVNQYLTMVEDITSSSGNRQPEQFKLRAFPNPFNTNTSLQFDTPFHQKPEIFIINVLGETVRKFSTSQQNFLQQNSITWDGKDSSGRLLPTGVYFAVLKSINKMSTVKILLLR